MTRPSDKLKTKILLRIDNTVMYSMALVTSRQNIKPMFFIVAVMMVIMSGWFSTIKALEGIYTRQSPFLDSIIHSETRLFSFRMFEPSSTHIFMEFIKIDLFPVFLIFGIVLIPTPSFIPDLFLVFLITLLFYQANTLFAIRAIPTPSAGVSVKFIERFELFTFGALSFTKIKHGNLFAKISRRAHDVIISCSLRCGYHTALVRAGSVFAHAFGSISFPEIISQNRCSIKISAGIL